MVISSVIMETVSTLTRGCVTTTTTVETSRMKAKLSAQVSEISHVALIIISQILEKHL